jgi:hypothetical protein
MAIRLNIMTELELHKSLTRYYHLVNILDKLLSTIKNAFPGDKRWFLYSEKVAQKLLGHCKSLCLNSADTFILDNGQEKKQTEYMDIPGLFINIRAQSDTYAILYHLFFDDADWEIKRLRFDLWRIDSLVDWIRQKNDFDFETEREQIHEITDSILNNLEFQKLTESQRSLVFKKNDDSEKIYSNWKFNSNKLNSKNESKISWREIFINSGLKGKMFENAHSFFSMYVHSNFFSVNHLSNLSTEQAIADKNFAITFSSFLIVFTLDDFCYKFSQAKEFASMLTQLDLEIIKSFLIAAREKEKIRYFA